MRSQKERSISRAYLICASLSLGLAGLVINLVPVKLDVAGQPLALPLALGLAGPLLAARAFGAAGVVWAGLLGGGALAPWLLLPAPAGPLASGLHLAWLAFHAASARGFLGPRLAGPFAAELVFRPLAFLASWLALPQGAGLAWSQAAGALPALVLVWLAGALLHPGWPALARGPEKPYRGLVIWLAAFFAAAFWLVDSLVEYLWVWPGQASFAGRVWAQAHWHDLWHRALFAAFCLTTGGVVAFLAGRVLAEERRHGKVMESASNPILRVDPAGRLVYMNRAAQALAGRQPEALLGSRFEQTPFAGTAHGMASDEPSSQNLLAAIQDSGPLELQATGKDGDGPWLAWTAWPADPAPGGQDGDLLLVASDVSDRVRADELLLTHVSYLEAMDLLNRAIAQAADPEAMLQPVMERLRQIFEVERAWLAHPLNLSELSWSIVAASVADEWPLPGPAGSSFPISPDMAGSVAEHLESERPFLWGTRQERQMSESFACGWGVETAMTMVIRPALGDHWMIGLHACGRAKDFTWQERRLFQDMAHRIADAINGLVYFRKLRSSEELYRGLFEQAGDAIMLLEPDSGGIAQFNDQAHLALGFGRQQFAGFGLSGRWKDGDPGLDQLVREALKRPETAVQGELLDAEGKRRQVDARVTSLSLLGKPYLLVTWRDLSERLRLESELRQAQKMEAVGVLAGGVAHDFNNILQAIGGYAALVASLLPPGHPGGEHLEEMQAAVDRAGDLIHQLLNFSRRSERNLTAVDLNKALGSAARLLSRTLPQMIEIRLNLEKELPPAHADSNQMEQIILNLAVNAKDAMPDGGSITIGSRSLPPASSPMQGLPEGDYLEMFFSDTGSGIEPKVQTRIFEPFFSTKEPGKGTGLGLSTVHGIVESHGGGIRLESAPGEGSTFHIYLPRHKKGLSLPQGDGNKAAAYARGHETLLLVDDERSVRETAGSLLASRGYRVLYASSGEEALRVHDEHQGRVDLVVLDLGMPGMGGAACLKQLLARQPELKVLVASGYSSDVQVSEILATGAADFLAKPYRLAQLAARVRQMLDHKPAPSRL